MAFRPSLSVILASICSLLFFTSPLAAQIQPAEFELLLTKAQAGEAEAQARVAYCYYAGDGVTQDKAKAFEWAQKSADQNNALGERNLSVLYYEGAGTAKDQVKAIEFLQRAADHGDSQAQSNIGKFYLWGTEGFSRDLAQAVQWLTKAAEKRDAQAEMLLGVLFAKGEGVRKDEEQGFNLTLSAACNFYPHACVNLAWMYLEGTYIKPDPALAAMWAYVAKFNGEDEPELFEILEKKLDETQLKDAEARAREIPKEGLLFESPQVTFDDPQHAISVPFEMNEGMILIKLSIGEKRDLIFMLDTGASTLVLNPILTKKLKLESNECLSVSGYGKNTQIGHITQPFTLSLPGLNVSNIRAISLPPQIDEYTACPIDGILGSNFLKHFVVSIDYEKKTVTFYPPSSWTPDSETVAFPMTQAGTPCIKAVLRNNNVESSEGEFLIDTGNTGILTCATNFQKLNPGLTPQKSITSASFAIGGSVLSKSGLFDALLLKDFVIKNPAVDLPINTHGIDATNNTSGGIGYSVLNRFTLTLDYPNQIVYLKKNANFDKPFDYLTFGSASFHKRPYYNVHYVVYISENTPAEKAGLKIGDLILAIDGHTSSETSTEELNKIVKQPGLHQLTINRDGEIWQGSVSLINPYDENDANDETKWQVFKKIILDPPQLAKWREPAANGDLEARRQLGYAYLMGYFNVKKNRVEAANWLIPAANDGDLFAQGLVKQYGLDNSSPDPQAAIPLYQQAVEKDDSLAALQLANLQINANGDKEQIRNLLTQATSNSYPPAENVFALAYEQGKLGEKDYNQSITWYQKAVEQNYSPAQNNLGNLYYNGRGVKLDYDQAFTWYQKAAANGHIKAMMRLAQLYYSGLGTEENKEAAFYWYWLAANSGNDEAKYFVANMYANGEGTVKDYEQAIAYYQLAANRGNLDAQLQLAYAYQCDFSIKDHDALAIEWFRKAADQGSAEAQCWLGIGYLEGVGIEKNPEQAVAWLRKSAEQNQSNGQKWLADCYEKGLGVTKDLNQAKKWYQKAADQGDDYAKERLKVLDSDANSQVPLPVTSGTTS